MQISDDGFKDQWSMTILSWVESTANVKLIASPSIKVDAIMKNYKSLFEVMWRLLKVSILILACLTSGLAELTTQVKLRLSDFKYNFTCNENLMVIKVAHVRTANDDVIFSGRFEKFRLM